MRSWGAVVAGGVALAVAGAPTAGAGGSTSCAPLTIPGVGGGHFRNISVDEVTCAYARGVFIPAVFAMKFPKGWAARVTHPSSSVAHDVWLDGSKRIVFDLTIIT